MGSHSLYQIAAISLSPLAYFRRATCTYTYNMLQQILVGALVIVVGSLCVQSQPFNFTGKEFQSDILEATQRAQDNYTGFVFDLNTGVVCVLALDRDPSRRFQCAAQLHWYCSKHYVLSVVHIQYRIVRVLAFVESTLLRAFTSHLKWDLQ